METTPTLAVDKLDRRGLILRDTLTFLSLLLVTVVLFAVTLFLFRTFTLHRKNLAVEWSQQARAQLAAHQPEQAVQSLQLALSYAPGDRSDQLLLAQALAEAGPKYTDEAYNYFTSLWDTQPGDGFINFELARLAAVRRDPQAAINFYRASIDGKWEENGAVHRRNVRLELSRYLIAQQQFAAARVELMIVGGNTPHDAALEIELARLLVQANAPKDALTYLQSAASDDPQNTALLEEAGRLAYQLNDFTAAQSLLQRAVREDRGSDAADLLAHIDRLLQLAPSGKLPVGERVARILDARTLVKRRLDTCAKQSAALTQALAPVLERWKGQEGTGTRGALLRDSGLQDTTVQLIYDTELVTARVCGAPTGDDALLLQLAEAQKSGGGE